MLKKTFKNLPLAILKYHITFIFCVCLAKACRILVPQSRIKPSPPALEAWSLNY